MLTTLLVREPLHFLDLPIERETCSDDGLLAEAERLVGYSGECDASKKMIREWDSRAELSKALITIGIDPFSTESVELYQDQVKRKSTPKMTNIWKAVHICFIFLGVGGFVTVIPAVISAVKFGLGYEAFVSLSQFGVALAAAVISALAVYWLSERLIVVPVWRTIPIREYTGLVPEFALQTAVDIRQRCPHAEIFVEELVVEEVVLDPFLLVRGLDGTKHYLEVWNEHEFVQKRVV